MNISENNTENLLLLFVKHPVAGKAKTRLAAGIGHEKALEVYRKLLQHTKSIAQNGSFQVVVFYGNEIPENDLWAEAGFVRFLQEGEGLGERMENAFKWGFKEGYKKIVIIGSDNALLTQDHLKQAFDILEERDVVIGPAIDGGYYLLGMKSLFSPLFYDKNWSTATVFQDTIKDLDKGNLSWKALEKLSDVDVVEDLEGTFLEEYQKFKK